MFSLCSLPHMQVGVRILGDTPQANSLSETQRVVVAGSRLGRSLAVKYLYAAAANTSALALVQVCVRGWGGVAGVCVCVGGGGTFTIN